MKKYSLRGWNNVIIMAGCVLYMIIALCMRLEAAVLPVVGVLPSQLILWIGERKLTKEQWKKRQNERDERYWLALSCAAAITAGVLSCMVAVALIWAALIDNEFATIALGLIFCVGSMTFCIALSILNKKL